MNKPIEHWQVEEPEQIIIKPSSLILLKPRKNYANRDHFKYLDTAEETTSITNCPLKRRKNFTNGYISPRAGARLRTYIKYLFWISNSFKRIGNKMELRPSGKISFLTLTLSSPQQHSDQYIKSKMLNQFITEITKKYPNIIYIWRAERQKNGNIHFHFLINKFIPWKWCRFVWNRIQDKEGYIEAYRNKFKNMWFEEYIQNIGKFNINKLPQYRLSFAKGQATNWSNPNSIDVVDLRTAKSIQHYISKYISKDNSINKDENEFLFEFMKIEGHLYFCSTELTSLRPPQEYLSAAVISELNYIKNVRSDCIFHEDFYTLIKITVEDLFNLGCYELFSLFIKGFGQLYKFDLFTPK